jgi:hypothetical protein
MNHFSPVMVKCDHDIQDPKRRGRDNEHGDRRGISRLVVQRDAPSRGGVLGAPRQIPADYGLTDIDAELEQFDMSSSGGSGRGFRRSSWVIQNDVISIASRCESPCDAIRSRWPV